MEMEEESPVLATQTSSEGPQQLQVRKTKNALYAGDTKETKIRGREGALERVAVESPVQARIEGLYQTQQQEEARALHVTRELVVVVGVHIGRKRHTRIVIEEEK